MIETKRVVRILTDLEGVNEDLLNLYEDIRQEGDPHDAAARRENLRLLSEYNEKLEAFEAASSELRALIERITQVDLQREVQTSAPVDKTTNAEIIHLLDTAQPHTLAERFTFRRPYGFRLFGEAFQAPTWRRLYQVVCQQLARHDPQRFQTLAEAPTLAGQFAHEPGGYRVPLPLPYGLYCEGNVSAQSICGAIRRVLTFFSVPESELVIYLRGERQED